MGCDVPPGTGSPASCVKRRGIKIYENFFVGIRTDCDAVKNAFTYSWTNEQKEGRSHAAIGKRPHGDFLYPFPYDKIALANLQELLPERKAVGVYVCEILLGGGNIHCITQQQRVVDLLKNENDEWRIA